MTVLCYLGARVVRQLSDPLACCPSSGCGRTGSLEDARGMDAINSSMAKGKATLGQMSALCRQHDEITDEDVIVFRGALNRIVPDKVIRLTPLGTTR